MVLAISAVEQLGQTERWTKPQKKLLKRLAATAKEDQSLGETERNEVADAVVRAYRFGLGQGVRRVLDRLNLAHLKSEWTEVYSKRSVVVHGLDSIGITEQAHLANGAFELCRRIILTAAANEGAPSNVD
jgi:hypothetical protein